jgi:tetratricopeptide (TPR) repeat protein
MQYQIAMAERLWGEVECASNGGETAFDSAIPHYRSAINICRKIGAQNELAHSLAALGLLQLEHRDRQAGIEHLKEALAIYDRLGTLHAPDKVRTALARAGAML